ncbi:MAG: hypothetical protein PHC69_05530 [Ruminiclostridium sp.]|nr:hypothetical protein [Ruminiclostridium sp.]
MDEKMFELMGKMYSEITDRLEKMDKKLDAKADKTDIVRLEIEHGHKLDALFDGYKQLTEGQEEIKSQITALTSKVESQDVQITVLKGGKLRA